jgi:hypothetical protein
VLICSSRENSGASKQFDRVIGCLIAFAAQNALKKYGYRAAVSLLPKTEIRSHYKRKYGMVDAGKQVFLYDENLKNVIKEYL